MEADFGRTFRFEIDGADMPPHQQNEAACLLQSGAIYHERIGLQPEQGSLVFAGFKQGAFSLYFGDAPIFHFDLEGRWQRAYIRDRHYLKRLDASIHEINRVREGANLVLKRRVLDDLETGRLDSEIREVAAKLRSDLDANIFQVEGPPGDKASLIDPGSLRLFLGRIAAWDAAAWRVHEKRYHETYGPLPFMPPDCQNAVILQATRGDAGGRSFGAGKVHEHGVRTPEEFAQHVQDVAALLGNRLLQTRSVFLAGADVLRRPADDVLRYLDSIRRTLPLGAGGKASNPVKPGSGPTIDDVHVFLDDFTEPIPSADLLINAHKRRLSHLALGVESGDREVRGLYGKTWQDEALQKLVSRAKESSIELCVLTLVGAGGAEYRADHVAKTARLIKSLALTRGDLVLLLDEREISEGPHHGPTPLNSGAWGEQLDFLRQGLSSLRERGVKVLQYSMAKQWA